MNNAQNPPTAIPKSILPSINTKKLGAKATSRLDTTCNNENSRTTHRRLILRVTILIKMLENIAINAVTDMVYPVVPSVIFNSLAICKRMLTGKNSAVINPATPKETA
jgi:hypothetical protein